MPAYRESKGGYPPLTRQDVDAAVQVLPTSGYEYSEWLGVCASIIAAYIESGETQDAAIDKALDWSKKHAAHNEKDKVFRKRWTGNYDPAARTPAMLVKRAGQRGWKRQTPYEATKRPVRRSKPQSTQHTKQGVRAKPTRESAARPKRQVKEENDYDFCELAGRWLDDGQSIETADALARGVTADSRNAITRALAERAHVDAEPIADAEPLGHPLGWQRKYDPDSADYWDAKGWRPIPLN